MGYNLLSYSFSHANFSQKSESRRVFHFNWSREILEQKKQFFVDLLVNRVLKGVPETTSDTTFLLYPSSNEPQMGRVPLRYAPLN